MRIKGQLVSIVYLIKNLFFFRHDSETKDAGPVFFGINITFGLRPSDNNNDSISRMIMQQQQQYPLPGADRCLLGKVVVSLGKKTFYVGAGLAERILEVIVLV